MMKTACLAVCFCWLISSAFGQHDGAIRQSFIKELFTRAASHPLPVAKFTNTPRIDLKIPASLLLQTGSQRDIQSLIVNRKGSMPAMQSRSGSSKPIPDCEDTSYRRLIGVHNGYLIIQSATQSADGGMFVSALMHDTTLLPNPWWKSYGLLIKLDQYGDVTWLKQFDDLTPANYSFFSVMNVFELPNRDIICTAFLNNDANTDSYRTVIFRLTNTGNIIWRNCLRSDLSIFNSPAGTFTFWIESAAEGLNGDIILCGTSNSNLSSGKIETVVLLNNQGKVVWDANYGNHGDDGSYLFGSEGISAFVQNGQIILAGLSHGTNYPETAPAVNFLTLNYNNGALLKRRFFKPDAGFEKWFTYWANKFTRLSNGHFLFYGKLFSDFMHTSTTKDHFGVIEFDAAFDLVNAYTISSNLATNYYNNILHFDASGKGMISLFEYLAADQSNVFFGSFQNQQFKNQRKAFYSNTALPGNNGAAFLPANAYGCVQSYFEDQLISKSYIEFRRMHDSDTSSICLGKDTQLLRFLPLSIVEDPTYYLLDPNEPNKMTELQPMIRQVDGLSTTQYNPCQQSNYCDTLKIHGNPVICGDALSITFTAFKNAECGASVQWNIDNDAIDSVQILNDSSVTIWSKNINWQGKLYASLPAGKCNTPAQDSILINVTRSQAQVDLGRDTILCTQNQMVLHAGNTFHTYQWQDGSTDSVLNVSVPGIYWVNALDFCGNNYTDSIIINPFDVSINIGPDRIKCNNDTLQLAGPAGFMNYVWSNNYAINTTTGQNVVINPLVDTVYYLIAEKTPGCFAYDTIRIKVNQSSPIYLGEDIGICSGDTVVLNAGTGFDQYQWSNGISTQQTAVFSTGAYSIIGTAPNGCRSYDTLNVNVWPNPVVALDDNPQLCFGSPRNLQAGNYASYRWQDGSTFNSFIANDIGIYYVTVTDGHQCIGSDTVHITTLLQSPEKFLPADTVVCKYGSLLLQSPNTYDQYKWSNNAATSSINVTSPGLYWLEVMDAGQCTGRDTIIVLQKDCLSGFYIPTAFTPGNNGLNDYFKPIIGGVVEEYQFTIYNRWGQAIFTTKDLNKGWNGTIAGLQQETNVFAWVCSYRLTGQPLKKEQGTVVVIK